MIGPILFPLSPLLFGPPILPFAFLSHSLLSLLLLQTLALGALLTLDLPAATLLLPIGVGLANIAEADPGPPGGGSCALEAAAKGIAQTTGRSSSLPVVGQRRLVDTISELLIGIGVILLSIDLGVSVVRGRLGIRVSLLLVLLWASRVEVVVPVVVVPVVLAAKIEQIAQPATATTAPAGSIVLVPSLGSTIVGVAKVGVGVEAAAATAAVAHAAAGRLKLDAVGPPIEEGPVRRALRRTGGGVVDVGGGVAFLEVAVTAAPAERGQLQAGTGVRVGASTSGARRIRRNARCRHDEGRDAGGGGGTDAGNNKKKRGNERITRTCMRMRHLVDFDLTPTAATGNTSSTGTDRGAGMDMAPCC